MSGDVALELKLPFVVLVMANETGDLDLMHREDHAGRAARRAEDRADVGDIGRAGAAAAELGGNHHAEQTLLADRLESLGGEAAVAVHRLGELFGHGRRPVRRA